MELGKGIFNSCPGSFNIGHAIGKRETNTIGLTKCITHYGRYMRRIKQVHTKICSIVNGFVSI